MSCSMGLFTQFTLSILCYQGFEIPYSMSFQHDRSPAKDYQNFVMNAIFALDMIFNCNIALPDPDHANHYITDRRTILKDYVSGW